MQAALRRIPRPTQVYRCGTCGAAQGMHYATCQECYVAVERFWLADWQPLLDQKRVVAGSAGELELAEIIFAECERHSWTLLDMALTHLNCSECAHERGGGPSECSECAAAWGVTLWAETVAGRQGLVTGNEHALHVGRMILRHPHRQSESILAAWSRSMPRLLTGWLPSTAEAQHFMAKIKAGRITEVDAALSELDRMIAASPPITNSPSWKNR